MAKMELDQNGGIEGVKWQIFTKFPRGIGGMTQFSKNPVFALI